MIKDWIAGAIKRPGAFTKKAEAAGKTVSEYTRSVLSKPGYYDERTRKQAQLAMTLKGFRR